MSSCELLPSNSLDLGVVLVKFDHRLGPVVLSNNSTLSEDLLMKLAIKGTSTLMNGLPYDMSNSRRFRGLLQLSEDYFVYGFDMVLIDDKDDNGAFVPVLLFVVFPTISVPIIGSNLRSIEQLLYKSTQSFLNLSHINVDFGFDLRLSLRENLL
ncbi:MAG: hypothetical protein H7647_00360 [Candidatus Heimdallarchaeota archaeon]|jgi:hypothetical protein|nr:hypothetical protein [Candidatus Heimdallarchaeota archaeon]MCK4252886.1 hypothetical protein [Candidatus Heimdallarchaeota archaeon]